MFKMYNTICNGEQHIVPLDLKGESGRYTLSYPRGRYPFNIDHYYRKHYYRNTELGSGFYSQSSPKFNELVDGPRHPPR